MYITENYWGHFIGESDDSLTITAYLSEKGQEEISLEEVFADFGLDKLGDALRRPETPLECTGIEGWSLSIQYAIDLVTDLAALLLECRVSGTVDLYELNDMDIEETTPVRLTASPETLALLDRVLADFSAHPLEYDLSEMVPEEDMLELAAVCGKLREELTKR